jgi:hypothetical protein
MTCYVQVKQAAELRRRKEEMLEHEKIGLLRRDMHDDYMKRKSEGEELERRRAMELSLRQPAIIRGKKESQMDEMRKRERWRIDTTKKIEAPYAPVIFTPAAKKKKPAAYISPKQAGYLATTDAKIPFAKKKEKVGKAGKTAPLIAKSALSLSVEDGLPVSLSVGQKQIKVSLLGKNPSTAQIAVALFASACDSQKKTVPLRLEPRACAIPPEGESRFKVSLDLPEDVSRGRLEISATLKENAIYIDRPPAESNIVELSSQVKSPMDLKYQQGSAKLTDGALAFIFNNAGESGGILEVSSKAVLFPGADDGTGGNDAHLTQRTKVKGGQKGIMLIFSPVMSAELGRIGLRLEGKDSNGKPYLLKSMIKME